MTDWTKTDWDEPVMVEVNGELFPTQSYGGVQRFVPDEEVYNMVMTLINSFNDGRRPCWDQLPEKLRTEGHSHPVVQFMLEKNKTEHYGLNELAIALHNGSVTFEDYLTFNMLHGYSVSGWLDAAESTACNLDLGEEAFTLHNPLWE